MESVCVNGFRSCTLTSRIARGVRVSGPCFQESAGQFLARSLPLSWDDAVFPRTHTIFEGTSEIQQLVIARAISGMRIE